jgi:hypothetical protein
MSIIAEKIFEVVKTLPDQQAAEILDFAEFLQARQTGQLHLPEEDQEKRKARLLECFSKFQIDLTGFKFDREEANARR